MGWQLHVLRYMQTARQFMWLCSLKVINRSQRQKLGRKVEHQSLIWIWPVSYTHLTEDLDFLKDRAYPVIEGAVKFYLGFLFPYGGYYVTGPSTSPENRFCGEDGKSHSVGMASTMDISILKELFGYYLKICDILGIEGETADVKRVLSKLPPFKTGSFEQIREWFLDYPETEIHHRHVSHRCV